MNYKKIDKASILGILILANFFIGVSLMGNNIGVMNSINHEDSENEELSNNFDELPEEIQSAVSNLLNDATPQYPSDYDIGNVLADRDNEYNTIYEPWRSQAAVHAITYDEDTGFLAVGGGYLYDNEIHIYRQNTETGKFDKVWDAGGDIIQSDIMCLAFGDTDLNNFLEIVAGSSDGHVYVFEQNHIYDPYTNTENMFELVWTSPSHFRVFDVKVADVDRDYRPDIVVGSWDGLILYEYDDHSNYPFNEEHWISYREVFNYPMEEKIYSLDTGDTNYNGLPEIVVGTREGTVMVFENDGLVTYLNGQPFPLISDNHYYLKWTSENYTWTPILDMDIGELDGSDGDELAIIAQGQGVLTLDWNDATQTYDYQKVVKEYKAWETFGYWGLDYYVDRVIDANNVTYDDPVNVTILVPEPIQYVWNGGAGIFIPDADVYPFNTGMAGAPDGNYSTFDATPASIHNATAIVDFGLDEEGTGSANSDPDVIITFESTVPANIGETFNFSVSQNGGDFIQIDPSHFEVVGNELRVDVDTELHSRRWDFFQYAKISVLNGSSYNINSLELMQVYNLLTDSLSCEIGPMRTSGNDFLDGVDELDKIIVGTVYGKYISIGYDSADEDYDVVWDSGEDDRYVMETGIWDIVHIDSGTDVPIFKTAPLIPTYPVLPVPSVYNSWAPVDWDPYDFDPASSTGIIMGTRSAQVEARNNIGIVDAVQNLHLTAINSYIASNEWLYSSVAPFIFQDPCVTPALAIGLFNPAIDPVGTFNNAPSGNILFGYRSTSAEDFESGLMFSLINSDTTGDLTTLVSNTKTTPKMEFFDFDGDGDEDMILSIGQLYLARNEREETGTFNFTLVNGYFDQVNAEVNSYGFGQPDVSDINGDGVMDLVISYVNSYGATIFLNEGDELNPSWKQDKSILTNYNPDTNIKLMNLTDARMVPVGDGYFPDNVYAFNGEEPTTDACLIFYNNLTGQFQFTEPEYNAIDSYLVATNPLVSRMDFSLVGLEDNAVSNIGFHVRESWNNDFDLEDWSLSISSGDIDGDGNGELIVGDYDNNMYIFEILLDNTYKRMYQSPDFIHEENTTESPYLYDDLEGISGEFVRRIWDHAEFLLADVDLDGDGLKEVLVVTGLQIHVFEDADLFGGDQLLYVNTIDLRQTSFENGYGWEELEQESITAITYGDDLDYDGDQELIIGAGPFLFIFNIAGDNYAHCIEDGCFVTNDAVEGRYALIGNPNGGTDFKYAVINAITTGDSDEDGYREVIIGGIVDKRYQYQDGFVYIYESQGGTFYKAWEAPLEIVQWNPVTTLTIDDQDYDGAQEIIIGHTQGFDIWEWVEGTDSTYFNAEFVTSNPNYPIKIPSNCLSYGNVPPVPNDLPYSVLVDRGSMDLIKGKGPYEDFIYQAYTNGTDLEPYMDPRTGLVAYRFNSIRSRIWIKGYVKSTDSWSAGQLLNDDTTYMANLESEIEPSGMFNDNGELYFAWVARDTSGNTQIWAKHFVAGVGWTAPYAMSTPVSGVGRRMPKVFEYDANTIGLTYVYNSRLAYSTRPKDLSSGASLSWLNFPDSTEYTVHSSAITKMDSGEFVIAMSAINNLISKPDYDIWTLTLDNTFDYTETVLHQATTSHVDELYPDIDFLRSPEGSLAVVYETLGVGFNDRIGMVGSTNKGFSWRKPHTLGVIHDEMHMLESVAPYPVQITWEFNDPTYGWKDLTAPIALSPTVIGLDGEGFMYSYTFSGAEIVGEYTGIKGDYPLCIPYYGFNLQSDWILNDLTSVVDLAVGDTDNDGRREIAVGWDNQVSVYELNSSVDAAGNEFMDYTQDWLSDPFENEFTGITIYDTNGNGWEEIGIATKRGNVYLLENPDPSQGPLNLYLSEELSNLDSSIIPCGPSDTLYNFDFDSDGDEEILVIGSSDSESISLFEINGSLVWNLPSSSGYIKGVAIADITNDSIPELLIGMEDGHVHAIDLETGIEMWSVSSGYGDPHAIVVADLDNDGWMEVIYGSDGFYITILDHNGNIINDFDGGGSSIYSVQVGNFSNLANKSIIFGYWNGVVKVMDSFNGSIIYESPSGLYQQYQNILVYDVDEDGFDEIIVGGDQLHVINVVEGTIPYNSTYYGPVGTKLILDNFDSDDDLEVLVQTPNNGIYLEDPRQRQTKWHYQSRIGEIKDITVGKFGGTGNLDVAIAGYSGAMVVIDGFNGNFMWFNTSSNPLVAVTSVDYAMSNESHVVTWNDAGFLQEFKLVIPNATVLEDIYPARSIEYDLKLDSGVIELESVDYNQDGIDELVWIEGNTHLVVWDVIAHTPLFEAKEEKTISRLYFADLEAGASLETIIVVDGFIIGFSGANGNKILEIDPLADHFVKDIIINEFNSASDGIELCVLYENGGALTAQIRWFTYSGNYLYQSDTAITNVKNKMVAGHFRDKTQLEVAVGYHHGDVYIFDGVDGKRIHNIGYSDYVYGMDAGDFDDNGYDELVLMNSASDITAFDIIGVATPIYLNFDTGDVRSFIVANFLGHDNKSELIINVKDLGIFAYEEYNVVPVWYFHAPLTLSSSYCEMKVADHNMDGQLDISFKNYNYWNVIDGGTEKLLWHFKGDTRLNDFTIGLFDKDKQQMGMAYTDWETINIVSTSVLLGSGVLEHPSDVNTGAIVAKWIGILIVPVISVAWLTMRRIKKRRL